MKIENIKTKADAVKAAMSIARAHYEENKNLPYGGRHKAETALSIEQEIKQLLGKIES